MSDYSGAVLQRCPDSLWEELARADASATFFQTPAWHRLAERHEGTQTRAFLFEGPGWRAILPLQIRRKPWGFTGASPFGTYSGLLSDHPLDDDAHVSIRASLGRMNLSLPGSPFSANPLADAGGPVSCTRLLHLSHLDIVAWEASWSRNHRRLIRDARDSGLTVATARNMGDVANYVGLYRSQLARWGTRARRAYPDALFHDLFTRLNPHTDENALRLWLARDRDGSVVAGRLCLYHNTHAVEWHAAATHEAMTEGANHLLVHAAVVDARARGFSVYDFNPNPGLPGVDHFKRGFTTETLEFRGLTQRSGVVGALAALRTGLRTLAGRR